MSGNDNLSSGSTGARKSILVLSLSKHLTTHPISDVVAKDWARPKAAHAKAHFDNVGFDLDPVDVAGTLKKLKAELGSREWDGVVVGWCTRGHVEFTELFESVVAVCVEEKCARLPGLKLMFNTGPENLVEPVVRNFPVEGSA